MQDIDEAHFDAQFDVNVKGLYFTVQKALPLFTSGGAIVLTSSVANAGGMPTASVYSATKAAVRSLARTFATALAERGIRVNAGSPGPVETPIFDKLGLSADARDAFAATVSQRVALGRFGRPEEIAEAVLFLASDQSSLRHRRRPGRRRRLPADLTHGAHCRSRQRSSWSAAAMPSARAGPGRCPRAPLSKT